MSSVSFSGIASGIDGDSIIEATMEARRLTKAPMENKIAQNNNESKSIDTLKEKLATLEKMLREFASFSGTAISKSINSSNENTIAAAVGGNASAGTVAVRVHQLASTARVTFDNTFQSTDSLVAPNLDGPAFMRFTIGQGSTTETVEIEVTNETTITELATLIGDAAPSKISGSLINVGSETEPAYKLMISTQETGVQRGSLGFEFDEVLQNQIFTSSQSMNAQDAKVFLEGIGEVSRSRNIVNDLIPGVTMELKDVSASPVILRVSNDTDKTAKRVGDFVEAYNDIVRFINSENKITRIEDERGVRNEFGTLSRTQVDNQLLSSLRLSISETNIGQTGGVRVLADLGITTDRLTGELSFDPAEFEKKIASNGNEVTQLLQKFSDTLASSSGVINSYTSFNGLLDQVKNSKQTLNDSLSKRLAQIDSSIEQQRTFLKRMFSRLEETIGQMNSNASALSGLITQNKK